MWYTRHMTNKYEVVSSYCKPHRGQDIEHDRCYGKGGTYLTCRCKCHNEQEKEQ